MPLPNFLIIGAQKSGTSSLFRYLKAHPQIYMSHIKEPKFFALNGTQDFGFEAPYSLPDTVARIADRSAYEALFEGVTSERAIGEASTWYLHSSTAASSIYSTIPSARLIVILRHPVERAVSNYWHNRNYLHIETLATFEEAIDAEEERRSKNWGHPWYYMGKGLYYQHLSRYYERFDPRNIRVYLFRDLKANPQALVESVYNFLEVDSSFEPDISKRFNVSSNSVRSKSLHTFLERPHRIKRLLKPIIPRALSFRLKLMLHRQNSKDKDVKPELRDRLIGYFREDILQLQDLIDRDLSAWLK